MRIPSPRSRSHFQLESEHSPSCPIDLPNLPPSFPNTRASSTFIFPFSLLNVPHSILRQMCLSLQEPQLEL
ncbi:hypothetical protein AB205_0109760 [Aquarana catesbeiana]|uniref:Uncharacterized protein n=1 Tax=Aquarana catesbeiana TaxID=8400 RepID=A0A2G9QDY3_AQUCT|nr:hypothetical protein AB205_0109760 [Aquarana catesbeiana]